MTFEQVTQFAGNTGLIYFGLLFAVVLVYALRPSAKSKFDAAARIPLRED